jgi:hypothetical protein
MTNEDAASLICAVLGSEAVQDSVQTVESMRALKADFQGQHFVHRETLHRLPPLELRVEREHNVVEALACVIRFFGREEEYRWRLEAHDGRNHEIYTVFEVEYGSACFAVIRETIPDMNKVAIGRVVLTNREHIIALEPLERA